MRNGHQANKHQHHRMRGRNRGGGGGGKSHNPLTRVYESNGPDVKIRGTANHIAEKYLQLARDATTSGDPVAAENYYQHAEHYFRLIAAAQEQLRQNQPYPQQRIEGGDARGDDNLDDGDDNAQPAFAGEPHSPRDYAQNNAQPREMRQQNSGNDSEGNAIERLPSFITGGQQANAGGQDGQNERFPRRRRRPHRGPRGDMAGADAPDDTAPAGE